MRKYSDYHDHPDHFEVYTKMPPLNKSTHSHHDNDPHLTHKNYEPLSWDLFFEDMFYLSDGTSVFQAGNYGALFFCIHGAGQSALSFATLAREVKHFATIVAFDFKGHGMSKKDKNNNDFSIETLVNETIETLKYVMQKFSQKNVILVGHSLGGSVCARVTDVLSNVEKLYRIVGCIVIDVVYGTAIEALPFMTQIINDRPKHFDSEYSAIKWCFNSCTLRKLYSAKVSVPPQLVKYEKKGQTRYGWKVKLMYTEKYWLGWFKGLSHVFLNIHLPKILLTAEKERLDKELTIAQMQGKFKLVVIHNVGHSVQYDDYKSTAKYLYNFIKDFRIPMTLYYKGYKYLIGIANFHPHLVKY